MSVQRAAEEPYATRFEAQVTAIDGRRVWLDSTYFFAECGGQPADTGTVGDVSVETVELEDGDPVHVLEEAPSFSEGHRVLCSVDWAFRMYCMRAHTASHVLYGAASRALSGFEPGQIEITEEKVGVDLRTDTPLDDDTLVELDERVNRAVWESRPVSWETMSLSTARERDGIRLTDHTEDAAFTKGQVRVVSVGDVDDNGSNGLRVSTDPWDVAACGGTHVRNTREIGPVTIMGRSDPGGGRTRIELAVGPKAIERREVEKRVTFAASRQLGVPLAEATVELSKLEEEREELSDSVGTLQRELVKTRLESAESFERDGLEWVATTAGVVDANEAGEVAKELAGRLADVIVIAGDEGSPFAAVATDGSANAEELLFELTDEYGGGGGGGERLAWGGDFDVDPASVVDSLE